MPVYNGEKYLSSSIKSILTQTYSDFEFIIANDGSTDSTENIILANHDPRIVYINNPNNWGLSKTLNTGIQASKGDYIARMDADDIASPERLEKQLAYLQRNSQIGIAGSYAQSMDEDSRLHHLIKKPENHLELKWQSLFSTPLLHPTIMGRRDIFIANPYDEHLLNSEDYELWSRLIFEKNILISNIPEPYLNYRVFKNSFTQSIENPKRITSANNSIKNMERYLTLDDREKSLIIKMRLGMMLKLSEVLYIGLTYAKLARAFKKEEGSSPRLLPHFFSLLKLIVSQSLK